MSFNDDLMRAEAIREARAAGCTLPGVAELMVEFHGAAHMLVNKEKLQTLGEEVAASDTELGAKMRALLGQAAETAETAIAKTASPNVLVQGEVAPPTESPAVTAPVAAPVPPAPEQVAAPVSAEPAPTAAPSAPEPPAA